MEVNIVQESFFGICASMMSENRMHHSVPGALLSYTVMDDKLIH